MVHVLMNKSNGFMTVEKVFASSSDMGAVKAMEITSIVAKNVNIDVETFKVCNFNWIFNFFITLLFNYQAFYYTFSLKIISTIIPTIFYFFSLDACSLPKVVGPCSGFVKQYYYDYRADSCYEFEYSGCQGNKNRFQDKESCEKRCQKQVVQTETTPNITVTFAPLLETVSKSPICYTPVDPGSCNSDITAFYYDSHNHMCQAFLYGGCEGNANRFQTEEQCERLCGKFHGQGIFKKSLKFLIIISYFIVLY